MDSAPTIRLAALASCWLATMAAACADEPATAADHSLHFASGDFVAGRLLDSDSPDTLAWRCPAFGAPLHFSLGVVQSIQFKRPITARAGGPYCFELAGGDVLYGTLSALNEREVVVQTDGLGTLHLDRSIVHGIIRTGAADVLFAGPGSLEGWETAGPANAWREEAGQLRTDKPDATLRRTFTLPPLVRYELELSWTSLPGFELAIGVDKARPNIRPAFRLETWGDDLVIVREAERAADFCRVQKLSTGAGQVHLQVLYDQKQGRLLVHSATGELIGELTVPEEKTPPRPIAAKGRPTLFKLPAAALAAAGGVQLVNRRGELKLQRLTISRWSGQARSEQALNGQVPESPAQGKALLHLTNGTDRAADVRSYDAQSRKFLLRQGDADDQLDEKQVERIVLARLPAAKPCSVRLLLATGERISGDVLKIEHDKISLRCPGIGEPLVFPLNELHSLFVFQQQAATEADAASSGDSPEGRLELDGATLRGRLAGVQLDSPWSLMFRPRHADTATPLAAGTSGRLVYRDPPPPKPAQPAQGPQRAPQLAAVRVLNGVRTLLTPRVAAPAARPATPGDCLLHLRTGDTITCRVQTIDEQGVWFKSAQATADFVPHGKIKVLELRQDIPAVKIEKSKADRLLTLPRMQRDNPPEHLIRSLDGDYLRGRLLAMDNQQLQIECRLETRAIDRAQVARIIWLHPDEIVNPGKHQPAAESVAPDSPPAGARVQALPRDGRRLTFFAQRLEGAALEGQSEVLGNCRVGLDQIDQLLIGPMIDRSASSLAFHQWKLRPAAEPLPTPEEGAEPGASEGLESVLVGKPAPPIELDLLDGKKFRLADYKNKVVVLDFWASWCGPCLQTMPQVDKVAQEFADQGVHLVAINLEESPDRIKTALDRLKLETAVALDRDGRVAERYGAANIPQTVIIDRDGKVARLFVGAGTRFDVQLRQALTSVLKLPDSKTE